MSMRMRLIVALAAFIAAASFPLASPAAAATTFVVNRIGDQSDRNLSNSVCDVSTKSGKQCTLRAAIQEANDTGGLVTINFNITSTSKTITPASPLPVINRAVTINGYSQSGAKANTKATGSDAVLKIVLDGVNAGLGANGIVLNGSGAAVKGLVIRRFDGAGVVGSAYKVDVFGNFIGTLANGTQASGNGIGIALTNDQADIGTGSPQNRNVISGNVGDGVLIDGASANYNLIYGNYIGVGKGGAGAVPNGGNGVHIVDGDHNRVGGTGAGQGNVISGNDEHGVFVVKDSGASETLVLGNYIGTNAAGTAAIGNGGSGVKVDGLTVRIGDVTAGSRNVISGNAGAGIELDSDASTIQGNLIGTKADGTGALGNDDGIRLLGTSDDNTIGGSTNAAGNVIASSDFDGILILGGIHNSIQRNVIRGNAFFGILVGDTVQTIAGNLIFANGRDGIEVGITVSSVRITGNQIYANGSLGIDLRGGTENGATVTANDTDDPDSGGNGAQNFPVLTSATRLSNGITLVNGSLNSNVSTVFTIELFIAVPDASGHGEGQIPVFSQDVTTNSGGDVSIAFQVPGLSPGHILTATATAKNAGNTSEFSNNVGVVQAP